MKGIALITVLVSSVAAGPMPQPFQDPHSTLPFQTQSNVPLTLPRDRSYSTMGEPPLELKGQGDLGAGSGTVNKVNQLQSDSLTANPENKDGEERKTQSDSLSTAGSLLGGLAGLVGGPFALVTGIAGSIGGYFGGKLLGKWCTKEGKDCTFWTKSDDPKPETANVASHAGTVGYTGGMPGAYLK